MPTNHGPVEYDEFCTTLQRKDPGYLPQGTLFSAARLQVAQQGAQSAADPREIEFRDVIFVVGYNMGFAHAWEGIDHEAVTVKTSMEGCALVMNVQPPPSPALAHTIAVTCAEFAKSQMGSEPVHNLKCLLVGDELNSDLSGLQFKPGCPRGKRPTAE